LKSVRSTRKVSSIGSTVESYLHYIRAEKAVERYRELPRWPEVVGNDIAQVTHPEKIVQNVLYVRVPDGVWAQELSLRKREIMQRLFDSRVGPPLDDIIFLAGDPTEFSPSKRSHR